jgi:lipoyl(octanoyl) transferase
VKVLRLGRCGYQAAWDIQKQVWTDVADGGEETLILVEHDPVLTLGANFHPENLLEPVEAYESRGIEVITTDRGGDVTYHGPNQLVAYPIFDLNRHGRDVHAWIRRLESVFIAAAAEFGVEAKRFPPHTGVWIGDEKVAAIGVKLRRWVSLHGIALNCNNDLAVFESFVPCGIREYGVTSLTRASGREITVTDAEEIVIAEFRTEFF